MPTSIKSVLYCQTRYGSQKNQEGNFLRLFNTPSVRPVQFLLILCLLAGMGIAQAQCPTTVTGCDVLLKPIRINLGGPNLTTPDGQGRTFQTYTDYRLEGTISTPGNTITNTNAGGANGTSSQALYRTSLYSSYIDWHFAIPNGSYTILLHYAETFFTAANKRVFDVYLEDNKVADNFDIFVAAGNAANKAVVMQYTTTVTGNDLAVRFEAEINNALIAGIEIIPNFCVATQAITINQATVSGCYSNSANQSKATVSVEVGWNNLLPTDSIRVTLGTQTRFIKPGQYNTPGGIGTILSPQVVAFEINANSAPGTITTDIINNTACTPTTTNFTAPAPCIPTVCSTGGLGGTVFNDYNADGIKQPGETSGLFGVTVKAYDCNGTLVATATTDIFGIYAFTGLTPSSYPLRIEFSGLPNGYGQGTLNGADGRTTVQFINAPDCNADLGVLNPSEYCQDNPQLILPCYVHGNPVAGTSSGDGPAIVSFDYSATGLVGQSPETAIATASEVGSIWGEAYNKFTKKLFLATTVKRHVGLGPLGLGGLYVIDLINPNSPIVSNFLSVTSLGVNVGTLASNATRGLSTDNTLSSNDPLSFSVTAKIGIGGITLSDDGNTLFFTNLFDRKLYKVDMTAYNTSGTLPTTATAIDFLGGATCNGGTLRPWATKFYRGKVYAGVVCDAGTSQNKSDLRAYVYQIDPGSGSSTIIFDFPLTYPKGYPNGDHVDITGWFPWTDNWLAKTSLNPNGITYDIIHPEPIFNDIEFDIDGSMILAFGDRTGIQSGTGNNAPNGETPASSNSGFVGGDILRAYSNGSTFVLESNATAGPNTGYGPDNNQGPGFGEFYNDNFGFFAGQVFHAELVHGGLAVKPGSGEVVVVVTDPIDGEGTDYINAAGVRHYNNTTGQYTSAFQVYNGYSVGTSGKATGLGDLILACDPPTFLEIGNRVWLDDNKNGVQDPCEKVLAGVNVSLYQGTTLIASTTTNANGEYYFNNNPVSSTLTGTVSTTNLLVNTTYSIVFGAGGQFASNVLTVSNGRYQLTTPNSATTNASDLNDSDAQVTTVAGITAPVISVTTGISGSVNHTYDVGFYCLTTIASISVTPATCSGNATPTASGRISLTNIQNADKVFLTTTSTIPSYTATGSQPVSSSAASFTGLSNPASTSGQSYSIVIYNGPCCYTVLSATLPKTVVPIATLTSATICAGQSATLTASGGTSYTFSNGITNTTGLLVVSPTSTTAYSVSVANATSGVSGCISTTSATVTVNPRPTANLTSSTICAGQSTTLTATGGTSYSFSNGTTNTTGLLVVSPVSTTAYSVTVANASGCTSTTTGNVTVNPAPVATLSSAIICAGQSATLTATGGTSYTFSNGTINTTGLLVVSPVSTTAYSVTVANASGCSSTTLVALTVNPLPVVGVTTVLCQGLTTFNVSFSATPGASASVNIGTLTGNTVTGIPSGQVLLITVALNSCTATSGPITQNCASNAASLGDFVFVDTNKDGIQQPGEPPIPGVTVTLYTNGAVSATTVTNASGLYSFTGLTPGNSQSYVVGFTAPGGYTATLANQGADDNLDSDADVITGLTQSVTLAAGEFNSTLDAGFFAITPSLMLQKLVDKSVAFQGDTLTYTLILTNTGTIAATSIVVRDSTNGLTFLAGSSAVPAGTTFTVGLPISLWSVSSISAGQSLSLTYQALVDSTGVIYNTATIPGIELPEDSVKVCTSVPVHICPGDTLTLTAPIGRTSYSWYRDGVLIANQTTNTLTITQAGSYSLSVSGAGSSCPDFSCCPVIVELDSLPVFTLVAVPATCVGQTAQVNGKLTISGFNPAHTYQYSAGATFNPAASLSGAPQMIPAGGILANNLASPASATMYTVRVYNASGCYTDQTVILMPTICGCPVDVCVPYVIQQTKRVRRIGDAR